LVRSVLTYDPGPGRLYVAGESGVASVFRVADGKVTKLGQAFLADNAHTVADSPVTHLLYLPLARCRRAGCPARDGAEQ
jgi:hypothetical protein